MKRKITIFLAILLLIPTAIVLREFYLIKGCQTLIHDVLLSDLKGYRYEHDGHYPPDIAAIEHYPAPESKVLDFVTCPAVGMRRLTTDTVTNADYIYVNWEPAFGTNNVPGTYPVLYDRRLKNHRGLGVNIITMDGRHFFDFHVKWLRDFSAKYPQYHLVLPE